MAVIPTGSPAWTRTASMENYGGHTDKQNYLSRGPIDALTDVGAEDFSRLVGDLAAAVRTAPAAVMKIQTNDTVPDAPTITWITTMWTGVREISYEGDAPPAGFPSAERDGDGAITVTFAASYTDEYGQVGAFAPRSAHATPADTSAIASAVVASNTVEVVVELGDGTPIQDALFDLVVW